MKLNFPKISASQVALLRVDSNTGIVLDGKFKFYLSEDQTVYSIFDNYNDAMNYVELCIKPKRTIDATLYDSLENVLYYYDPFKK